MNQDRDDSWDSTGHTISVGKWDSSGDAPYGLWQLGPGPRKVDHKRKLKARRRRKMARRSRSVNRQ